MSYIDNNLLPDEQIIYRTKKHVIIFLVPLVWTIATLCCLVNANPFIVKLAFAPAIAGALSWIQQLLNYVTSEFAVTNKRILMKEGFFFRHANEMRLATVSNVNIGQSLLGQMLNYGTIIINPFGGENDVFDCIAEAGKFQKQVQIELDKVAK